jgi:hypothetical protein
MKISKKYNHERMIKLLNNATSKEDIKQELKCIFIENMTTSGGSIQSIEATDAFRLHKVFGLRTGFEPGLYNIKELQKVDSNYPDTKALKHPEDLFFTGTPKDLLNIIKILPRSKSGKTDIVTIKTENRDIHIQEKYLTDAVEFISELFHITPGPIKILYSKENKNLSIKLFVGDESQGGFALIMPINR